MRVRIRGPTTSAKRPPSPLMIEWKMVSRRYRFRLCGRHFRSKGQREGGNERIRTYMSIVQLKTPKWRPIPPATSVRYDQRCSNKVGAGRKYEPSSNDSTPGLSVLTSVSVCTLSTLPFSPYVFGAGTSAMVVFAFHYVELHGEMVDGRKEVHIRAGAVRHICG